MAQNARRYADQYILHMHVLHCRVTITGVATPHVYTAGQKFPLLMGSSTSTNEM